MSGVAVTPRASAERPLLRGALAAVVIVDLVSLVGFIRDARAAALAAGTAVGTVLDVVSRLPIAAALALAGSAAAVAFARRPGRLGEGAVALAALASLSTVHAQLFGSPWRHLFFSGACLLGWLTGLLVSRSQGMPRDESYARIGSIAVLAATYLSAGLSKIAFGGAEWLLGVNIQNVIVGQDGLAMDGIVAAYRAWVVATPLAAAVLSVATVAFELASPLMLCGSVLRAIVALGLIAMHLNIFILTPILYWESMVLLFVFGLSRDHPVARAEPVPRLLANDSYFAAAAASLAGILAVAIAYQGWRSAVDAQIGQPPVPGFIVYERLGTDPTSVRHVDRVGPLMRGQPLADGWHVESLGLSDDSVLAVLTSTAGAQVRFEITCADAGGGSPFDIGRAHVFYSSDVDLPDLRHIGLALRDELRSAADGSDLCARLASWGAASGRAQPQ